MHECDNRLHACDESVSAFDERVMSLQSNLLVERVRPETLKLISTRIRLDRVQALDNGAVADTVTANHP